MKTINKLFLVAMLFSVTTAVGQTQRIELFEEFTGENCWPCATVNTGLTQLITKNQLPQRKIVLLRYQCAIPSKPGKGSLYLDNPTEVETRQSYYSVPFAPYSRFDGIELPPTGNANALKQNIIDDNYLVNAPFSIAVTHGINKNADSITVVIKAKAMQNYVPSGALKLRCALTEESIHFATAPGTNGEKDFEFIMRKMLPDANGSGMTAGTWTNGQTQDITLTAKIPAYIKDKTQIAIVVFIQDDGNKKVLNTAYSEPVPLPTLDLSLNSLSDGLVGCVSSFAPIVGLKNTGTPVITSASIDYSVDNGAVKTYSYSGTLASGAIEKIVLPQVSFTAPGPHTITASVKLPNGQTDVYTNSDTKNGILFNYSNPVYISFSESFSSSSFPPSNSWRIEDESGFGTPWIKSTASLSGSASGGGAAMIEAAWIWSEGIVNTMTLPLMQLGTKPVLSFYLAAAPMENVGIPDQKMDVLLSRDCGATWTNIYSKTGANFFTHAADGSFEPKVASDWRKETINLNTVQKNDNVLIKFIATTGKGLNDAADGGGTNSIYLDDINITSTFVGIDENNSIQGEPVIYPNPANDAVKIKINRTTTSAMELKVVDMLGQTAYKINVSGMKGENEYAINTSSLPNGVYTVIILADNEMKTAKFNVAR